MFARRIARRFGHAALTACLLLPLAGHAGPYSALYVFGDSLSDGGSDLALSTALRQATGGAFPLVPGAPADYQGRFSNGRVGVDYLATALGLPLTAHYVTPPFLGGVTGGNNYAQGGATSGTANASVPGTLNLGPTTVSTGFNGMSAQVADYLAVAHVADPNAAYVVWAGANDFLTFGSAGVAPGCSGSAIAVTICTAITNITSAVATLASLGAHHIVVPNLPDLGATARAIAGGPASIAQGHAISVAFNAGLATSLSGLSALYPGEILPFDLYSAFNDVLANPAAYGFTNTTMACLSGSAADATSTITAACAAAGPNQYVYWDDIHPTTATHAIIGQRLAAVLGVPEPADAALFAIGLVGLGAARGRRRRQSLPALGTNAAQ